MQEDWLTKLEGWMRQRGTMIRGFPKRPMSPYTVKARMTMARKVLRETGWLDEDNRPIKDYRFLKPQVLVEYMEKRFPDGSEGMESAWNHYAFGIRTLANFLHFKALYNGKCIFSEKDLEYLRLNVYTVIEPVNDDMVLTEDFLDRYENKFLPWLKDRDMRAWAPAAFLFFTAFRFHEMSGMDRGLKSGTVLRGPDGTVTIIGKRRHGIHSRDVQELLPEAEDVMKDWMDHREKQGIKSDPLFINSKGGRLGSEGFNRNLRRKATESGFFKGGMTQKGTRLVDPPTGEIRLIRSHVIGRKAAITRNVNSGVGIEDGMSFSRHRSAQIYMDHYVKSDPHAVASRIHNARNGKDGNPKHDPEETANAIVAQMSKEEKQAIFMALAREVNLG